MTKQLLLEIADEARKFIGSKRSLELATVTQDGQPLASYAPFYRSDSGIFYIFVSTLAAHTSNLDNANFDNRIASILIIEDEKNTPQIYARARLSFQCITDEVPPGVSEFDEALGKLKEIHGAVITTLSSLADFRLFKLTPQSGRYIKGFGQAYEIDSLLTQVKPVAR